MSCEKIYFLNFTRSKAVNSATVVTFLIATIYNSLPKRHSSNKNQDRINLLTVLENEMNFVSRTIIICSPQGNFEQSNSFTPTALFIFIVLIKLKMMQRRD